jgi:hypothetical protein
MQGIIRGLKALLPVVSQHPLATTMLALCVSIVLLAYGVSGNVDTLLRRYPSVTDKHTQFDHTIVANNLVDAELERLALELKADRVLVLQFHNGMQDLTGLPFTFVEITYGAVAPGVALEIHSLGPVPLSAYGTLLRLMWADPARPVCIQRDVDETGSPLLRARLEMRGVKIIHVCPVVNLIGAPVGLLTAEYMRRDAPRPSVGVLTQTLAESAMKINGYLASGSRRR